MKKKNLVIKIVAIISILLILGGGGYLVYHHFHNDGIPSVNELIKEKEKQKYQDKDDNKKDVKEYVNELPQARQTFGNPYIMGRVEIPNLNIDSWITRASNNDYYLKHNIYNQYDELGVAFFDYRNTDLAHNMQINVYGHNSYREQDIPKLPFVNLEAYVNEDIFKNYKTVYLSIDEKQVEYEVIAVKIVTTDNEHMKVIFYSYDDYLQHVDKLLQNTLYKEDVEIKRTDRLLVLQACHFDPMYSYLLVICKEKKA